MKQLILLSISLILFDNLYSQDNDCTQYHTGKFTYNDSTGAAIIVKRKKKFQVETNESTGVWTNFRITWKSDCEYQLEQVGTNSKAKRKYNHTFSSTIISKAYDKIGYEYSCACKDADARKVTGMMKRIFE